MHVAVVIPYFQRRGGILRKAVRSILEQQNCPEILILVVDDSSPVSAESEIAGLELPAGMELRILHQPNGGPSNARNHGLDAVPPSVEYVAFLDSDDEWTPPHLHRALSALEPGFDFYFANLYQLGQQIGAFERAGRLDWSRHRPLPGLDGVYVYGDDMFRQLLTGNVIGTPTVVIRNSVLGHLRFREEFVYAGEDYLFWMDCARATKRIVFSSEVECVCGAGVNLYSGSVWGTESHLDRLIHEIRFLRAVPRLFPVAREQRLLLDRKADALRLALARDLLHRVVHRKALRPRLLLDHFRRDYRSLLLLLPNMVRVVTGRAQAKSEDGERVSGAGR